MTEQKTLRVCINAVINGESVRLLHAITMHTEQMATATLTERIINYSVVRPANWLDVSLEFPNGMQYAGQDVELHRALQHCILLDSTEADSV